MTAGDIKWFGDAALFEVMNERDEAWAALDRVRALADQIANEQGGYGIEFQESQGEFAARMHAAIAGDGPQRTHDRTFCERCDTWHAWKHQDGR